jgi:multiple sugar transport system permease protein
MTGKLRWHEMVAVYVGIALLLIFILAPFVEAAKVSLSPMSHLLSSPYQLIPPEITVAAYSDMWRSVPGLGRYIINSLIISGACTLITLLLAVPCGYALARLRFRGQGTWLMTMLGLNMFSGALLLIPLYRLLRQTGLLNTYAAMILPGAAFLIPTAIWLLQPFLKSIPHELEEAAAVDGASRVVILWRVVLPLSGPGLVVVAATSFIGAYAQQFLIALTFNSRDEIMPISIGLFQFFGRNEVLWNQLMAASLLSIVPVVALFAVLQRRIVGGLTAGGVKG